MTGVDRTCTSRAEACECLGWVGGGPQVGFVRGVGEGRAGYERPPRCDCAAGIGVRCEVGEHVEHVCEVLARVLPVRARAGGVEVVPSSGQQVDAGVGEDCFEFWGYVTGEEAGGDVESGVDLVLDGVPLGVGEWGERDVAHVGGAS